MEIVNATIPIDWEVSANATYDPETHTFTEPFALGRSIQNLGLDWHFQLPQEKRFSPVIYDGGLKHSDADTGELLTFLPVRIVNDDSASGTSAEACH